MNVIPSFCISNFLMSFNYFYTVFCGIVELYMAPQESTHTSARIDQCQKRMRNYIPKHEGHVGQQQQSRIQLPG